MTYAPSPKVTTEMIAAEIISVSYTHLDNTETALLRVKGDTLFYADAATAPVEMCIRDSPNSGYPESALAGILMCLF